MAPDPSDVLAQLRATSATIDDRFRGDCAEYAARIAAQLLAEGYAPWIGCVRDVREAGPSRFHAPLVPLRYLGRGSLAWTAHYVACAGRQVFDPIAGAPLGVDDYGLTVFGRKLDVAVHLDCAATARRLASGDLARACRP